MFCAHFLLTAALAANPDLEKATKLVGDLQYAEARAALESALKRPGNDRETLLRIYELQGVVYATLNDPAKASKAFQMLAVLDPDRKPMGDQPPRVMTPFYEARGRASEVGRLDARPLPAAVGNGRVGQLAVEVTSDPLKMVKRVRFHVKADDKPWVEALAEVTNKNASVGVDGARVEWWADVLGDKDAVLVNVGSEAQPRVDLGSDLPGPNDTLKQPPPPVVATEPVVTKSAPISGVRIGSIACLALGVIGIGTAVAFGVMADGARKQIESAPTNGMGQIVDLTQKRAYELAANVKTNATLANTLYVVGGALTAAGIVLFIVGGSSSSSGSVSLMPAGNGFALSGTW